MKKNQYVIGVDYGTDSCRVLIVNTEDGAEVASSVKYYPRWKEGKYCNPSKNQYRQHPLDYTETLEAAIKEALLQVSADISSNIIGMSFDMTGSTPVLTDKEGTPLAILDKFKDNPDGMFILWKDHTAIKEADEINKLAKKWDIDYTMYSGGIYSSEWVLSKVLHLLRTNGEIRKDAYSWIEHTDWIPALLTGKTRPETVIRSRCAAGHKAMWNESWNGLPSEEFLITLSPYLSGFRSHLSVGTYPADKKVGFLTPEWADRLGLSTNVAVGVGAIDCHVGAVGAGIAPGTFVRVMGTSTCDVMVVPYHELEGKLIPGICGQVDGSVIPGLIGLEAGQSAFGDVYAWFRKLLEWPLNVVLSKSELIDTETKEKLIEEVIDNILPTLSETAAKIKPEDSTLLATDWLNGRRTPDANQLLCGTITGLTLGSTAPLIYRALVEATAFGSLAIIERFLENDIKIKDIIAIGGISLKSPLVMQILSDVIGVPIKVARSQQACALGAAMFASVISGVYNNIEEAQKSMGKGFKKEYFPNMDNHAYYSGIYKKYITLGKFTESLIKEQ
jgi:L-ribulokinase